MLHKGYCALGLAALLLAAPAKAENIKIGVVGVAGFVPVYVAQEKGYFAAEGVPAELIYFDAAQPVAVATVSGDIDFGVAAVTAGFYNLAGQGELKIIAAAAHEFPGFQIQAYLVSKRADAAGLHSLKDLPGHSFALTGVGAPPAYVVGSLVAEKYHFDYKTIRVVPLQTIPNINTSIAGGQTDFTTVSMTTGTVALIARGDVKLMGWVGDETPWQFGIVFASTKTANERGDTIQRFLRAYRKGAKDYHDAFTGPGEKRKDGPGAGEMLRIIAKYTKQSIEDVKLSIPFLDAEARLDVKDVLHQVAFYKSQGMMKPAVDGDALIDRRYVTAMPER
jgi:NitT/TauT family transport system substrate-binding protein